MTHATTTSVSEAGYPVVQSAYLQEAQAVAPYPIGGLLKRLFDIVLSALAIVALAPLLIGVALAVRFTGRGPVLYGHERVGFNGNRFRCWKFRSMVEDAPAVLAQHLRDNPAAWREWSETQKLRDDPRVTPLGRALRALSLDELPQLFNILFGDMSIVGPRPVTDDELARYGASSVHYLRCRPGLTGLWQVSGRSDLSYRRRVLMDRYYACRWSFAADLRIVVWTVPAVVFAKGSF